MNNISCDTHFVLGVTYTGQKKKHTKTIKLYEQAASGKRFTNNKKVFFWKDVEQATIVYSRILD